MVIGSSMLEFHKVLDPCNGTESTSTTSEDEDEEDLYSSVSNKEDDVEKLDTWSNVTSKAVEENNSKHPYISTRWVH